MESRASARFVRITPMKARRVVNLIRGLSAREAQAVLKYAEQAASETVGKVLSSAMANAKNNLNVDPATLYVAEVFVDEGPTMKRIRPRAQGRAYRIDKRTSHITLILEPQGSAPRRKPGRRPNKAKAKQVVETKKTQVVAKEAPAKTTVAETKKPSAAKKATPKKTTTKKTTKKTEGGKN